MQETLFSKDALLKKCSSQKMLFSRETLLKRG